MSPQARPVTLIAPGRRERTILNREQWMAVGLRGGAALCANDLDQLASVECTDCQASHCRDCDAILHRNPQRRTHKRYAIKGTLPRPRQEKFIRH